MLLNKRQKLRLAQVSLQKPSTNHLASIMFLGAHLGPSVYLPGMQLRPNH